MNIVVAIFGTIGFVNHLFKNWLHESFI